MLEVAGVLWRSRWRSGGESSLVVGVKGERFLCGGNILAVWTEGKP